MTKGAPGKEAKVALSGRQGTTTLMRLAYQELRQLAAGYLRHERDPDVLQPTALVHEAYLKLVSRDKRSWESKSQFCAIAARCMRQVLVEQARALDAKKRGGKPRRITLNEKTAVTQAGTVELLALDEALNRLEQMKPRQCRVVELRAFGGLNVDEAAFALGVSERTVKNDWRLARAWLASELRRSVVSSDEAHS